VSGPADVVAALAGLGGQPAADGAPVTPQALIDLYCQRGMQSGWRSERRESSMFNAGFCGFDGRRGYDDGHGLIENLAAGGWRPLPELGDWPLMVFLLWPARSSDARFAIAHYCEGDLAIEVFDGKHAAAIALGELREQYPA